MKLRFIEKTAEQIMVSKTIDRNAALKRPAVVFGSLALLFGGIALFAPIDDIVLSRRSSDVPLAVLLWGLMAAMSLLAAACLSSMDRQS